MKENKEKENPNPSRMRGRGVEVSKTLFYKKNLNSVEQFRIKKGNEKFMFSNLTNSATFTTKRVCFSALYVDILCTKRVENAVEI